MAYNDPYNGPSRQSYAQYTEDRPFDTYGGGGQGYSSDYLDEKLPPAPPRNTGMLGKWRKQDKGKVLMRGGGLRFFGRCLCCTIMFAFVLIVGIVFALAMFIKPPNLTVNRYEVGNAGYNGSALTAQLNLSVTITNPSYFSIGLRDFEAQAFWPGVDTELGSSELDDIDFGSNSKTTFPVPIEFAYSPSLNSSSEILSDIIDKCGLTSGSTKGDLTVDYTINLGVRILGVTVHPKISKSASFECPFDLSDITSLAGSSGSSTISSIIASLTGST